MRAPSSLTVLTPPKSAERRKSPKLARKVLRQSLVNGTRSARRVVWRNMATAFCGDSKMISSLGLANDPSGKLRHLKYSQCYVESKAEVLSRLPIRRCRTADKCCVTL